MLTGTGAAPVTVSPATLTYSTTLAVGTPSASKTVTITNKQTTVLTINSIGTSLADYAETNTCGTSVAAGASCTVTVIFTPTAVGARDGTLTITDSAMGSPQTVAMTGGGGDNGLKSIAITPATSTIAKGLTSQFTATGTYGNGTTGNVTALATWTSSTTNVTFSSTTPGLGTGAALGSATISAAIVANGKTITGSTTATVGAPALVSLAVTPASSSVARGLQQQFTATGTYSDGTTQNLSSSVTWTSSPADITFSSTTLGLGTGAVQGSTTVSAAIVANGKTVTGSTPVTVGPPVLESLAVTPVSPSLALNARQQLTATGTYSDLSTQNLSSSVTWTSVSPALISITNTGMAQVLGTSTAAIAVTASMTNASGVLVTSPIDWLSALSTLPIVCPTPTIDMNLLVVNNAAANAGAGYADFPAITQILNYVGTPYTVVDISATTLPTLSDGACHGYFQGVIYAFGDDIYNNSSLYQALTSYEITFGVRQLNWFTNPTPDFGLNYYTSSVPDTGTDSGVFQPAAAPIFYYANIANPVTISNAFVYLTTPLTPAGGTVTPLLMDSTGNALSAVTQFADGRQYLSQMFDSNQYLTHDLELAYGLVNWVTKGVFLGDYHVYAVAQVDDFFIDDSEWVPLTSCQDPITNDRTAPDASSLPVFRITSTDMTALTAWQSQVQADPLLKNFELSLAFNGVGTAGNTDWTGLPAPGTANDTLVSNLASYQGYFHWMTHTYDHPTTLTGLCKSTPTGTTAGGTACTDAYDTPPSDDIDLEILTNLYVAGAAGGVNLDTDPSDAALTPLTFTDFNPANAVTPGVTGLNDPYVPGYLYADGIRYVVTDTSVATVTNPPNNNGPNPSPNVGIVNSYEPGIYEVPRHPNDVFYNAANWNDDTAEFDCIYSYPNIVSPFNGYHDADILNFVSNSFVTNMLMGDMDPEMFHQPDLHNYCLDNPQPAQCTTETAFAGLPHSLLGDVYTKTFSQYEALYKLPILSPTLDQLGQNMQNRNAFNLSGVTASLVGVGGATPTITITVPATATVPSAVIPVTGLNSSGAESYGGVNISHLTIAAGTTITLPLQ
jgi:hypothetical protein